MGTQHPKGQCAVAMLCCLPVYLSACLALNRHVVEASLSVLLSSSLSKEAASAERMAALEAGLASLAAAAATAQRALADATNKGTRSSCLDLLCAHCCELKGWRAVLQHLLLLTFTLQACQRWHQQCQPGMLLCKHVRESCVVKSTRPW